MAGIFSLSPVLQHHIVSTLRWPGLRPLQEAAAEPLIAGEDAILLAPTAGGKTEAAIFPILTRMAEEDWTGLSVLYICPLKALLNNLAPRLSTYAAWLGRTVEVWHGDVGASARKRIQRDQPDILLTTPESLEAMLVSTGVDDAKLFAGLQTVIIDEVHAFAGDDRGWHLSAVLSRLEHLVGRQLQRIGMSATVGNPDTLLSWLQGGVDRSGCVIAPGIDFDAGPSAADITVDSVDDLSRVALLLSQLHAGEKRLVFVDSRRRAEELAAALRSQHQTVYLSHSSLSAEERRRSEAAFADARNCFIVATSTLELGIDVGDLDRVIQVGPPRTVASFLQRLGRTGRRPGTTRNCLFIATDDKELLPTLGMLSAWSEGYVEPVIPPPAPRHLAAQQILAAALHTGAVRLSDWQQRWGATPLMRSLEMSAQEIINYLLAEGFLEVDGDFAFIGPSAEQRFGRQHFMSLLSAFTTPPVFTVLDGKREIGTVEERVLVGPDDKDRVLVLALAGRNWHVTHVDWNRHRVFVEPTDHRGVAKWGFLGPTFGEAVSQGMRRVLLGDDPAGVRLTKRAIEALESVRAMESSTVSSDGPVFVETDDGYRWYTYAGGPKNMAYLAALGKVEGIGPALVDPAQRVGYEGLRLLPGVQPSQVKDRITWWSALPEAKRPIPQVNPKALWGLKFADALREDWAAYTLGRRLTSE